MVLNHTTEAETSQHSLYSGEGSAVNTGKGDTLENTTQSPKHDFKYNLTNVILTAMIKCGWHGGGDGVMVMVEVVIEVTVVGWKTIMIR